MTTYPANSWPEVKEELIQAGVVDRRVYGGEQGSRVQVPVGGRNLVWELAWVQCAVLLALTDTAHGGLQPLRHGCCLWLCGCERGQRWVKDLLYVVDHHLRGR
jgi:hypothetical protein